MRAKLQMHLVFDYTSLQSVVEGVDGVEGLVEGCGRTF